MQRYLTPRALGLAALAVVLIAAMVWLGLWQLDVYDEQQRDDTAEQLTRDPVPLDDLLGSDAPFPAQGVGRPVLVEGRYLTDEQLYVDGLPGSVQRYAVVTPMLTGSGSAVLVVRGSSAQPAIDLPSPGSEPTAVSGVLEAPTADGAGLDDARITDGLRIAALAGDVDSDLYGGYVIADRPAPGLAGVDPAPPEASRWTGIKNLVYALQWWLFAGFVAFMWWRIVRDLAETDDREGQVGASAGSSATFDA